MILTQNNKNKSVSDRLLQDQNQGKVILVSILLELPPLDPEKLPVAQRRRVRGRKQGEQPRLLYGATTEHKKTGVLDLYLSTQLHLNSTYVPFMNKTILNVTF